MSAVDQQLSRICSHCGMCCNGSLYVVVPLNDTDRSNLLDLVQINTDDKGDAVLQQPCPAHNGSGCTIYHQRPQVCRDYRCGVLDSVAAGELEPEQARLLVSQVSALATTLARSLSPAGSRQETTAPILLLQEFDRGFQLLDPAERRNIDSALLLNVGTLKIMLAKHFKVLEFTDEQPPRSS